MNLFLIRNCLFLDKIDDILFSDNKQEPRLEQAAQFLGQVDRILAANQHGGTLHWFSSISAIIHLFFAVRYLPLFVLVSLLAKVFFRKFCF
jgi:hypothetical protein